MAASTARVMAGIPTTNLSLYHEIRFRVGDPTALVELPAEGGRMRRVLILRDIEMARARAHARADEVRSPRDFAPPGGLSGDRETATAQAVAECLRRAGVTRVVADRTLPLIYASMIRAGGAEVEADLEWGVRERRSKDESELRHLDHAQRATEEAIREACRMVAGATARADGVLLHEGQPLTSERVRLAIDLRLLAGGFENPRAIVAGGRQGSDCHHDGAGELRTGEPVIIDVFPRHKASGYNGDCTRTVVHGKVPDALRRMHAAVVEAKAAATAAVRAGVTGESVHRASIAVMTRLGYAMGMPPADAPDSWCGMVHGTGHGLGLEVHEPPLLDMGGPALVAGDVLTVEPGLYCRAVGGVRVEDMVVVTNDGCRLLGAGLPEGLEWT